MTTLSHPFKNDIPLPELSADESKLVNEMVSWISDQPHFPKFTRIHAHQFLHACLWDPKEARKSMQKYCQIRASSTELFGVRDPMTPQMQQFLDIAQMAAMPKKTPKGYHVMVYRLVDMDPSKLNFAEAIKGFCMFNDYRISVDGLAEGYVVVFDMKGIRLGHLTRVQLSAMRSFMVYIQEAHPVRLKRVYVVNTASFINQVMALVKPLIKSELFGLLKFTSEGPLEYLTKDLLPADYGGELDTIESYYKVERKLLETEYRDWLMDSAALKENRVDAKGKACKTDKSFPTSFSSLEID